MVHGQSTNTYPVVFLSFSNFWHGFYFRSHGTQKQSYYRYRSGKEAPLKSDHTAKSRHLHQGTDDVLAHLLAFSAKPEEIEVLLVSVTFGNVDVQLSAPRSSLSLLHISPFIFDTITALPLPG